MGFLVLDGLKVAAVLGGAVVLFAWRLSTVQLDAQEPPVLKPDIPIIGHIVDMLRYSHDFYAFADPKAVCNSQKNPSAAAVTLPVMGGKMYMVWSPELMSGLFRARTLSFSVILNQQLPRLAPMSARAVAQYTAPEFEARWVRLIYGKMTGSDLFDLNLAVLNDVFARIDELPRGADGLEVPDDWVWLSKMLTCATATSLLGHDNPYARDPSLGDGYWRYDAALPHFVLGPVPWLTAPKAYAFRKNLHRELTKYYAQHKTDATDVSALIRETNNLMAESGWAMEDRAALLVAVLQGALFNTVPTFYWFFRHIISNPNLVARLREEVAAVVTESTLSSGSGKLREATVDISNLESRCPLLMATFRENQRVVTAGTINRWVTADTVVSDGNGRNYLFKKDSVIQGSQNVNHFNANDWGTDSRSFNADRFLLKTSGEGSELESPAPKGAFIPFGGGKHICPGRNFASMENWGAMVALLLGFEITKPDGQALGLPGRDVPLLTAAVGRPSPKQDLSCRVVRRKGWEDVKWKASMGSR